MQRLGADELVRHCNPTSLGFTTSADLPDVTDVVAQDRATEAIRFAIAMRSHTTTSSPTDARARGATRS